MTGPRDVPVKVGLLASVGRTLDGFFPPIVDRLRDRGFVVSPASGTHSDLAGWTRVDGVGQRPSATALTGARALRRWVRDEQLDVVVTNTATASALVRAAGVAAPVIYFCHGLHWQDSSAPGSLPWQVIEKALLRRTAAIITLNRDDEQWFSRRTTTRVHRLDCGIGVPLAQYPAAPVPASGMQLLWAGDFTPRKRPGLAVSVLRDLIDRGLPARLTMLGDGPLLDAVRRQIGELELGSVIETPGRGDVGRALGSSLALLHTATWEGLPGSLWKRPRWAVGPTASTSRVCGTRLWSGWPPTPRWASSPG